MREQLQMRVPPEVAAQEHALRAEAARLLGLEPGRVSALQVTRRSIDARQRRVMVNVTVTVAVDEPGARLEAADYTPVDYRPLPADAPEAIVVGAGPAGLFAALRLVELGVRPIVLERGRDVDTRRKDVARIKANQAVDPESNYCFGEGGAGAFSDGKLYTRSRKRGNPRRILGILHQHGARADILVDAHPHIGTDRLPAVIRQLRLTIERCGGRVCFATRVEGLLMQPADPQEPASGPRVTGVVARDSNGDTLMLSGPVILATGHSARDVYHFLNDAGIALEAKGIAVGVRLEHPQEAIDAMQYHNPKGRGPWLPPAEYSVLTRVEGRGVYSFCMCPGGVIVPAASGAGQLVVNGMSGSARGSRWANAGMVVEVLPEDVEGDDPLRMLRYQEEIERRFWEEAGRRQNAPAQLMTDFVEGRPSRSLPPSSYAPGVHPARVDHLLPEDVSRRLRRGLRDLGAKHRGFLTPRAIVVGDETRTSAPVRIPRHPEALHHIGVAGLYPCGEGAGYAGGIVSAAIDGERCAEALAAAIARQ